MKIRWLNAFTVSVLITLFSLFIYSLDLPFFELLESKAYDFKVSLRDPRPVSGRVVIVAIDEPSLKREGRWPWPRSQYARLVNKLTKSGAAVIGFDFLFPERETHVSLDKVKKEIKKEKKPSMSREKMIDLLNEVGDSDARFAEEVRRSERTVLGYFVYTTAEQAAKDSASMMGAREFELLDFSQYSMVQSSDQSIVPEFMQSIYAVGLSLPSLMDAANSAGYVSFVPERDGVIRFMPMVRRHQEAVFPPFSLQLLREATQLSAVVRIFPDRVGEIRLGESPIPVTEEGDFLVNYYGPMQTFTYLSASDVLDGTVGPVQIKDKIVLIGATAAALHDLHTTPYGSLYPGVEVHANVIENILQQDFLQRPPWVRVLDVAMILGTGILLGLVALYFKAVGTAVLLGVGVGGYLVCDYLLFTQQGLWVSTVFPVFSQFLVYFGITLYRFTFEEKEKRFIKSAFSQYLAPTVVDQLVENPKLLNLGGEDKVLTAFFFGSGWVLFDIRTVDRQ